jgi:hypothetical protein
MVAEPAHAYHSIRPPEPQQADQEDARFLLGVSQPSLLPPSAARLQSSVKLASWVSQRRQGDWTHRILERDTKLTLPPRCSRSVGSARNSTRTAS